MQHASCIFCKIINKLIPATIIKENAYVLVIKDISPKAPIHYLILPKKHIESIAFLADDDAVYSTHMLSMARDLGNTLENKSFNLVSNNGAQAGQSVLHLHMHFLAGKNLYDHGFKL